MLLCSVCTIFAEKNKARGYIMDGLIEFVLFVGFIGVCIFIDKMNDVMKKTQHQSPSKPVVINIPTTQKPPQPVQQKKTSKKVRKVNDYPNTLRQSKDISQHMEFQNEGMRSTQTIMQPVETQQHSEYEMSTAEDIRKAIVWSEVLKRKY